MSIRDCIYVDDLDFDKINSFPRVSIVDELTKYVPVSSCPAHYEYLSMHFRIDENGVHRLLKTDFQKFLKTKKGIYENDNDNSRFNLGDCVNDNGDKEFKS